MTTLRVKGSGTVLAADVRHARSVVSRTRGLMLRPALEPGCGLDIRPCGSIHMMFMRFSIDAVFYDREGRVTRVAHRLRPWIGLAFGGRGARGVVELPADAADGVQVGDVLEFDDTGGASP
ncbi:MAG: hypothetical protein C3F10_12660 [Dehalococcoidia bacterium]|nr:DUF192 domain-containing protein [Dehalococcoidia bacterium]MCZ7575706.1 DUF192 domain-containing protein [Dehalococcoidia bacterium]PWB42598.1 MAG: hypothetical protein C3F10_12660 [Dehalococcoidia bacterium]